MGTYYTYIYIKGEKYGSFYLYSHPIETQHLFRSYTNNNEERYRLILLIN